MPTLTAFVANCLIWGEEVTHESDGACTRELIRIPCDQWTFVFRQNKAIVGPQVQIESSNAYNTTVVEVQNVDLASLEHVLTALDSLCWLLSFATQSRVIRYGYEFPEPDATGRFRAVPGVVGRSRAVFELADGKAFREFVEMTYSKFRTLESFRKLPVVFDYLLQAQLPLQTIETSLLIIFVTLENLKDTYATAAGIPFVDGRYRKVSVPGGRGAAPAYSFKELLAAMFKEVGMAPDLKSIVGLRNEIIHSGLSRTLYAEQRKLYEIGHDLVREYVLRLLGFRGTYSSFSSSDWSPKHLA